MVTSIAVLERSAGSYCTVPVVLVNAPRTVEIPRCRAANWLAEWAGSICQVSTWAEAEIAKNNEIIRAEANLAILVLPFSILRSL